MTPRAKRWLRRVLDTACLALILAGAIHFWPATLGGSTRLVVVQGSSMEPTFHLGDLIIVRDNHQPDVGDIIVFHIPKGEPAASMLVVHRVVALRPDGSYLTRGDNRTTTDDFHITSGDVVGTPILGIPHAGRAIGIASMPLAVALAAGLVTTLLLWPSSRPQVEVHEDDAYVALDSLGTHEAFFRKAGAGEPLCHELGNLALAVAEHRQRADPRTGDLNAQ